MISMDEVYKTQSMLVYRYLLRMTGDEDLAEELTQETFYQAVKSIERYDESCKISTWLCAIAKKQLGKYLRKHPKTGTIDLGDAGEELIYQAYVDGGVRADVQPSAEDEYLQREERVSLMKAMRKLPDTAREVIYLRIFGNLSFAEIGEVMEKSENWARVTYYRGKVKLKEEVGTDE